MNTWRLRSFFLILSLSPLCTQAETFENITISHHQDMRFATEIGSQDNRGTFVATQFRYALHDLLDRAGDYPRNTAIEILAAKWRVHFQNTKPWLDELTLLRVLRVPSFSEDGEWSWDFDLGMRTAREPFCDHCLAGQVRGGLGFAEEPFRKLPIEVFGLVDVEVSVAPDAVRSAFQPAAGPRLGIRYEAEHWNFLAEFRYRYYFLSNKPSVWENFYTVRYYLGWDTAVEARASHWGDGWEGAGGFLIYF